MLQILQNLNGVFYDLKKNALPYFWSKFKNWFGKFQK